MRPNGSWPVSQAMSASVARHPACKDKDGTDGMFGKKPKTQTVAVAPVIPATSGRTAEAAAGLDLRSPRT